MVQAEVADRLAAPPRFAVLRRAQRQGGLVRARHPRGRGAAHGVLAGAERRLGLVRLRPAARRPCRRALPGSRCSQVIDAAFAQRRKTLRSALAAWAGSSAAAERVLTAAGVDPRARGETLDVAAFARIAIAAR